MSDNRGRKFRGVVAVGPSLPRLTSVVNVLPGLFCNDVLWTFDGNAAWPSFAPVLFCFPLHRRRIRIFKFQPVWCDPSDKSNPAASTRCPPSPILQAC